MICNKARSWASSTLIPNNLASLQCKVAKVTCEKRIYDITKIQKMKPHYADMRFKESETKLLELDEILYRPYVLPFFVQVSFFQQDYDLNFVYNLNEIE